MQSNSRLFGGFSAHRAGNEEQARQRIEHEEMYENANDTWTRNWRVRLELELRRKE